MSAAIRILKNILLAPQSILEMHQLIGRAELDRLRQNARYQNPKNLIPFGYKIHSQGDEDGIIREIFKRIGVANRSFVEFGVGNGLENNTVSLLLEDWHGLWIEGSAVFAKAIGGHFQSLIVGGRLKLTHAFVTRDNIQDLLAGIDGEIDLLSIDIDGNDVYIFETIAAMRPRVVVIEYNAKFPPPILFCIDYDASHAWQDDDCFGASLKYLEGAFAKQDYSLVGCTITGCNAFFVRKDLAQGKFEEPFSAEKHFEPARYYLLRAFLSGHSASYKTIVSSLNARRD